jgi:hypothetical protein
MQNAADALDLSIGQAQLLAGVPVLANAVAVLERDVLKQYARARLLHDPTSFNELMEDNPAVNPAANGPNCSTGRAAYDTLCMMQTNSWFAANVMSALVLERVVKAGIPIDQWRAISRLPFSQEVSSVLGPDILLVDAAYGLEDRVFAAWTIELPRVNTRVLDAPRNAATCWDNAPAPKIDKESTYYSGRDSSVCYVLPHFSTPDFAQFSFPYAYEALLGERRAIKGDLNDLCTALRQYPRELCRNIAPGVIGL